MTAIAEHPPTHSFTAAGVLDEIKDTANALAKENRGRTKQVETAEQIAAAGRALASFQKWISGCIASGSLRASSPQLLDVQRELSCQFMLGSFDARFFVGVPSSVEGWFFDAPWLHLALRRGHPGISLVCERFRSATGSVPGFALNFESVPEDIVNFMANHHYVDVRRVVVDPRDPERRAVTTTVAMTMEIRVITAEKDFVALLDGRTPDGFQNRSVFKRPGR
jgi:hypothetical protein